DATGEPEHYIVSSMNRTISHYPEVASAIAMQSVSNWDEARAFSLAADKYFADHPYFDKNLPVSSEALPVPPPPPNPAPVQEIFNGTPTGSDGQNPLPVVLISHSFGKNDKYINGLPVVKRSTTCSGTFITKNFILTAAHCFQDVALTHPTS